VIPGKEYKPEDLLRMAWRRKWIIVIPALLTVIATVGVLHFIPNQYRSETLLLVVPQRVPESYVRSTVTMRIEDRLQSITQQILSRTRLERIINDLNLYPKERRTEIMEDVVEQMRKDINVDVVKGDAFRVSYASDNPRTAMLVTERLSSFFIEENIRDREVLAEGTDQFLESELEDARRRLVENEQKLQQYREEHAGELPDQADANVQSLSGAQVQLQSVLEALNADRDRRIALERQLADAEVVRATAAAAPVEADDSPRGKLAAAQANLQALQMRYTAEHPDVIRAKRLVADLQQKVAALDARSGGPAAAPQPTVTASDVLAHNREQEMRAQLSNLDSRIAGEEAEAGRLRGEIASYQQRLDAAPKRQSELTSLMRDYDTLQQVYRSLLQKKEDSKVSANLERRQIGEQFRILDPARMPEKPFSPNRPRILLLGVLGGLILGLAVAAAREYLDHSLMTEEDATLALGLPVLATIPLMESSGASPRRWRLVAASVVAAVVVLGGAAIVILRLVK
jgi:polysaccharide chain length determinant protein (PEP-CTERM system associated)